MEKKRQGLKDLVSDTAVKQSVLKDFVEDAGNLRSLFDRSSKSDVETMFQKSCTDQMYGLFISEIKNKFTTDEFVTLYALHMKKNSYGLGVGSLLMSRSVKAAN